MLRGVRQTHTHSLSVSSHARALSVSTRPDSGLLRSPFIFLRHSCWPLADNLQRTPLTGPDGTGRPSLSQKHTELSCLSQLSSVRGLHTPHPATLSSHVSTCECAAFQTVTQRLGVFGFPLVLGTKPSVSWPVKWNVFKRSENRSENVAYSGNVHFLLYWGSDNILLWFPESFPGRFY